MTMLAGELEAKLRLREIGGRRQAVLWEVGATASRLPSSFLSPPNPFHLF